jgi:hypothetical protein
MKIVGEQRAELPYKYRKGYESWKAKLERRQEEAEEEVINKAMANPGTPFILLEMGPVGPGDEGPSGWEVANSIKDKKRPLFKQTPGHWYAVADRLGSSSNQRVWIVWEEGQGG